MKAIRVVIAIVIAVWSTVVLANTETTVSRTAEHSRTMAGHTFIPSDVVRSPFVTTHFGTSTGVGYATLSMPGAEYALGALGQWLDLQVAPFEWLALRGHLTGNVLSGANGEAALLFGAQVGYDFGGGLTIGLLRTERLQWSMSADYSRGTGYNLSPMSAVTNAISTGAVNAQTLFSESVSNGLEASTHFAFALHSTLGVWGGGGYTLTGSRVDDQIQTTGAVNLAGGISFDLDPVTPVPVGLLGYYNLNLALVEGATPEHNIGGGLFYTGRDNLVLGLEAVTTLQSVGEDADLTAVIGAFRLRYYW